jgi:hypothetical protein
MKRNNLIAIVVLCLFMAFPAIGQAENGSYLDTIYNAHQNGTSAIEGDANYVTSSESEAAVEEPVEIETSAQQKAAEKLEKIVNNLIRVIMGRLGGVKISIVVIPVKCPRPPVEPPIASDTPPIEEPEPEPDPEPPVATQTPPIEEPPVATQTPPIEEPPVATQTPPVEEPPTEPEDMTEAQLKDSLKSDYGLAAVDGNGGAVWTKNQLIACNETFASLPAFFRSCTDEIIRDGTPPAGAPENGLAYVIVPQRKIHMLNGSVTATDIMLSNLKIQLGHEPSQEEILVALKFRFQRTMVHEMTHCFQNTHSDINDEWTAKFWPGGKITGTCPTTYGQTLPEEDMAESVATYWAGGVIRGEYFYSNNGDRMDLDRYNFIKTNVMAGKDYLNK